MLNFLSTTTCSGVALEPPGDITVHQSKLHMEGFQSLKEVEAVEFTFKKSAKGLESICVTRPSGLFCIKNERWTKGKNMQRSKEGRPVLQGWKSRPSCQGMQAATPAQEVPLCRASAILQPHVC
ncbi:Protein lin-28 A [Saguinus oedipus]|uniref:Protein lin-28 A n=1 Tax=Saguinus oedipus TaxID=9490 RepID=A0ABQ9WBB0_SAGOE|nr:Protein lin-28 A [Saguinus oedipus]